MARKKTVPSQGGSPRAVRQQATSPTSSQGTVPVSDSGPLHFGRSWGPVVILLLTLIGAGAIRFRLLSLPMERDEGEYAYAGQLILRGHPPYEHLYNMKWPGTYYSYALIEAIFGGRLEGVHFGVLFVNLASIIVVYLIANRLFASHAAVAAAVTFAALSVSPWISGLAGHATLFVVLAALGGIFCLQLALARRRLWLFFAAGFLAGLAPLMKQPGVVFTLFIVAFWAWEEFRSPVHRRQMITTGAALLAGILTPFILLLVELVATRTLGTFWLWTVSYASQYGEPLSGKAVSRLARNFIELASDGWLFWILAGLGAATLGMHPRTRSAAPFLIGLLTLSFIGVCPALTFRGHYFILMLPAVALLVGAAVFVVEQRLARRSPRAAPFCALGLVLAPLTLSLWAERDFYFSMTPTQASQYVYSGNPFVEVMPIADYIREHSDVGDQIAVIGSEPEIYFYARRLSATGHIYTYPMMEEQPYAREFQQHMIQEIETSRPRYIVFVNMKLSWLERKHSDQTLVKWFRRYADTHLQPVAIVEMDKANHVVYRWDEPEMRLHPDAATMIVVYKQVARPGATMP